LFWLLLPALVPLVWSEQAMDLLTRFIHRCCSSLFCYYPSSPISNISNDR
jgi:hypothetical protein